MAHLLTLKVPSTGLPSKQHTGLSQSQQSGSQGDMQANGHCAVEDEDKDKDLECDLSDPCKPCHKSGQKACRFHTP